MAEKSPPPAFVMRMIGARVRPWAVPMRMLIRALTAVQRLVAEELVDDESEDIVVERSELHLLDVKRGSAAYPVAADDPEKVVSVLRRTGHQIDKPEGDDLTYEWLSPVEELSAIAKALQCEIVFGEPNGTVLATIRPNTYETISPLIFIRGEASIHGKIERVGGATKMHCGMRIPNQRRMIICTVATSDLVRDLGQHIYQDVAVFGTATWFRANWKVRHFKIKGMEPPKVGTFADTLTKLRKAGGSAWDDIDDPQAILNDIRGD